MFKIEKVGNLYSAHFYDTWPIRKYESSSPMTGKELQEDLKKHGLYNAKDFIELMEQCDPHWNDTDWFRT